VTCIVHITAGAGGRLCGSCLHDNTLVRALVARGRDAILVPAYVPTTTDEENVAEPRIVMGGVNVWLQEHLAVFRHAPEWLDRLLDAGPLLHWLSSRTGATRPADLGPLTVSTLEGERGRQRKEVAKLARWLARDVRPDVVHLSNALLLGVARAVREATGSRIVCTLSGEDIFIEKIPAPHYGRIRRLLRDRAADVDRFVALNAWYADFMADYLAVPRERIEVIPHGLDLEAFPATPPDLAARRRPRRPRLRVGFLARACPEKGLDLLVRALPLVAAAHDVELIAAGATVAAEQGYIAECLAIARELGMADRFHWAGQVDRAGKLAVFDSLDVFALPTRHPEAKGLSVIEAMAAGVPVVAAAHGTFPELLDGERAGLLHAPEDVTDLARAISRLLADEARASACGRHGHAVARARHAAATMAAAHEAVYAMQAGGPAAGMMTRPPTPGTPPGAPASPSR
jgi:glycosyltransferase involved in cell wall biosynthesis